MSLRTILGAPEWLSQVSNFSSGHDLTFPEFEPHIGLSAVSVEPASDPLSLFLKKKKAKNLGTPGWLRELSTQLLVSAQVTISWFVGSGPMSGSVMTVWGLLEILSPSAPPPLVHSLSLSQNK